MKLCILYKLLIYPSFGLMMLKIRKGVIVKEERGGGD